MGDARDDDEIELISGQLVDIEFVMTNLTGIPDEQFTPLGDEWEDDIRILPGESSAPQAPPVPPIAQPAPKSV